jgi:hypothetical protein
MKPTVRAGLLVEATADEIVVVDEETNEVFSLDPVAASVFTHADGTRDVAALVGELRTSIDPTATAELVWTTLDRLADAGLLVERVTPPGGASALGRRTILHKGAVGTAAAVGAGMVFTSFIPAAASVVSGPASQEVQQKVAQEEAGKAAAEVEQKTTGELAAKEGTEKGQEQGQKIGQELSDKAAEQGSKQAEVQTKEQLSKLP